MTEFKPNGEFVTTWVGGLGLIQGEEIVRCRDCKHYRPHEFVLVTDVEHVCLFWADGVKVSPDGFCAWAERRVDDAD